MIDIAKLAVSAPQPTSLKLAGQPPAAEFQKLGRQDSPELREAFHDFVGQSFFSQALSEMRKSVGKPAYFHGGMGEELFQQQLDQVLVENMSEAASDSFSQPMYELFMLDRSA